MNGEAIYGTRPWQVYGEGAVKAKGGAFKENFQYSAKDIRFTTKGKYLYAIALGWPADGKFTIRNLGSTSDATVNQIKTIKLLGHWGALKFTQSADGLVVELPAKPAGDVSDLSCALRITGSNLQAVAPEAK